jgi:outer membrane protein assembly factor BamB
MIRTFWLALLGSSLLAATTHAENWPQFRGPTGQGISSETGLPTTWSQDQNVRWKADVPGEGWSSPIVWGDQVFVTTVTDGGTRCHVLSFAADTGAPLWDREVCQQEPLHKETKNSYATPTPVTDGERIYAVFGDGSATALSMQGDVEWLNREVKFYSRHGLGSSPTLFDGLLIMPFDGSNRISDAGKNPNTPDEEKIGWQIPWDKSEIVAYRTANGERAWTAKRGMSRIAHATPIVIDVAGEQQLISIAGDAAQGFNPRTGERLWTVYCQGEGLVPSPVAADGVIFTASGFEKTTLRAIRTDGHGDVTASHIAWEQRKGVPTQPSLLYVAPYLYAIADNGVATCFDPAKEGEVVWQQRLKGAFSASPIYADGHIYITSEEGESTVLKTGDEFKIVAQNPLGEHYQSTLAISNGHLFIRTEGRFYCVGN